MTSFFRRLPRAWQPEPIRVYNLFEAPDLELEVFPIVEYHFKNMIYQYTFVTRGMIDVREWEIHVRSLLMHRAWHAPEDSIGVVDWCHWVWEARYFMCKWGEEGVPPSIRMCMETLIGLYSGHTFEELLYSFPRPPGRFIGEFYGVPPGTLPPDEGADV